jgi:hypothetical protein
MILFYNTFLLTGSYAILNSVNSSCGISLYSHFFCSICQMHLSLLAIDRLRRNAHRWSRIISSTYGLNFEGRILYKIPYPLIPYYVTTLTMSERSHIRKWSFCYLLAMVLFCIVVTKRKHALRYFSMFTSGPTSSLAAFRASVCFYGTSVAFQ